MKAMLLAAGRGERMRPLSDQIPKPLLKIKGQPLIVHHLLRLKENGIQDVVINLHHLGHLIEATLGNGKNYGVNITYSRENPILDTGGGILNALPLLGQQPFLLISSDIWTDYAYKKLLKNPLQGLAHLVMVKNPDFKPEGDFYLKNDLLHTQGTDARLTYANIGIYHPDLFKLPSSPKIFPLSQVLIPAIQNQQISAELFNGQWQNIGTVEQYNHLNN